MEGFEEAHAPGGPPVEVRQARKAAAERTPMTPPQQKKARTTELEALEKGGAPLSQVQLLSTRAMQNPRDTELDTLSQRHARHHLRKNDYRNAWCRFYFSN